MVAAVAVALGAPVSQDPASATSSTLAGGAEALRAQRSELLAGRLYLGVEPPELRAAQWSVWPASPAGEDPEEAARRSDAIAAAEAALAAVESGEDFGAVARRTMGGRAHELGSYATGMLPSALDRWLFAADEGAVSPPLDLERAGVGPCVVLLRRVPAHVGARTILLRGEDRAARSVAVVTRLRAGESFAALARELSDDEATREAGGALAVFQRGQDDKLLKAACFDLDIDSWAGPIESPLGSHFVQRVDPASLPPSVLRERTCVRLRALSIAYVGIERAPVGRTREEAFTLAAALATRLEAGESLAALAREHNDDLDGVARAGDLGWVFRVDPRRPAWLATVVTRPVGWTSPHPIHTPRGYVLVCREE